MYRCKDCQTEYREKPDYCECGNDSFDFIEDKKVEEPVTKNKPKTISLEAKYEIISRIFFAVCLVCAIVIMSIPMGNTSHKKHKPAPQKQTINKNIPSIYEIWDDTPTYQPRPVEQQPATVNDNTNKTITLTTMPVDYARRIEKPKPRPKKQNTYIPQKNKVTNQKVNNGINKTYAPKKATQKQVITQKPKVDITTPTPKKPVQVKPKYNPNSPEMLRYKGNLRATLFSKLAVAGIQGTGECKVQFSVDLTGKLINRKFIKESNNKSLNDSVYYMLMSMPKFTPPPTSYNGEPIQMTFNFNNGNYEISIY